MPRKRSAPLKLYSTAEAAQAVGISEPTVRRLARLHQLGTRKGRDWLFTQHDLDRMEERPRVGKYDRTGREGGR